MPHSIRTSRPQSTQPSPTSSSSAFSFSSFWSSFAKPSRKSSLTAYTDASISPCLGRENSLDCKIVWGISGKNFKPGLLFTRPALDGQPMTAKVLFLQMGKSFKTQCIDEPSYIIETLLRNFSFTRSITPSTSRFAACLTDENYDRLSELRDDAVFWEQCGEMDSRILAKGPILQDISGDALKRLLNQPNIFHILGEAAAIFSCTELGIPSPSATTKASSLDSSSPALPAMASPFRVISVGESWLYLEKHAYHATLQSCLDELLPHDPILSLPVETLHALIDGMTESQLLLNVWFAPYQQNGEIVEVTTESIASALFDLDKISAKESDEFIHAGEIASQNWIRDATNLKRIEHEFNVWNLALQRCEKMKSLQEMR